MIDRYILDDERKDKDTDGDWVYTAELDAVLYDLKTVVHYLRKINKVPLSQHILEKYKEDFKRIDLL